IDQQQRERAPLVLRVVTGAFQLPQLEVSATGEAPDVLLRVVSGRRAVDQPEELARDELEVTQSGVGLPQIQHPCTLAILLCMAQGQQRQAVALATAAPTATEDVNLFG